MDVITYPGIKVNSCQYKGTLVSPHHTTPSSRSVHSSVGPVVSGQCRGKERGLTSRSRWGCSQAGHDIWQLQDSWDLHHIGVKVMDHEVLCKSLDGSALSSTRHEVVIELLLCIKCKSWWQLWALIYFCRHRGGIGGLRCWIGTGLRKGVHLTWGWWSWTHITTTRRHLLWCRLCAGCYSWDVGLRTLVYHRGARGGPISVWGMWKPGPQGRLVTSQVLNIGSLWNALCKFLVVRLHADTRWHLCGAVSWLVEPILAWCRRGLSICLCRIYVLLTGLMSRLWQPVGILLPVLWIALYVLLKLWMMALWGRLAVWCGET